MHYRAPNHTSPTFAPYKFVCIVLILALTLLPTLGAGRLFPGPQTDGDLRFELPANGNIRVENLRGAVIARVWKENYLSVGAVAESGEARSLPAVVEAGESLLSIRLARGPNDGPRINLELRVPQRAHLAIATSDGRIEVRGVPAALLAQSVTGEIRVEIPQTAKATVVADSRTGKVTSSISSLQVNRSISPQLRGRVGGGGSSSVRIVSQSGNITLANVSGASARADSTSTQRVPRPTPAKPPNPRPSPKSVAAATPATVITVPQEVSEGDVIRVDTELASVNVNVVDRGTNRGFNDLTRDDFRLFEDDVQQRIIHFDTGSAPFNLILLIDLSGSTATVVDLIKSAALHFVEAARDSDRIAVITFADRQVVVSPLTSDQEMLRRRIQAIKRPEGSTKLYDSVVFAVDETLRQAKDSRRNAIVVLSDGLDSILPNVTGEGSTRKYEEMIRRVKEFDGIVYSIWTDTQSYVPLSALDIQQETFDLAHDQMKELAEAGGGAFYECERLSDLAGVYDRVVADLGTVYTLSYRPSNKVRDGSWRTIRVNVNRQNAVARGKPGYFAK